MNSHCRARLIVLVAGCTFGGAPVLAGEWDQTVSLPTTLEYDSNLPLATTNKQGVSRLIAVPAYRLTGTYGIDELTAGLGLNVERSSNQQVSNDREDPNLLLGWRRQTETGEFSLTTTYAQVSSRAAELQNTGAITPDSTQKTGALKGLWRSAITESNTLTADANYQSVSYDTGTQTNFDNLAAGIKWAYAWSERIDPFLRFGVSHYAPDKSTATVVSSDNYTASAGVTVKASEQLEWTAQGGPGRVSAKTTDSGWQGSVDMRFRGDLFNATLNLGRSVTVSDGGFVLVNRATGGLDCVVSEHNSAGVSASWQDTKKGQGTSTIPNTVQQLSAWASHEISPFWNARLYYQHMLRRQNGQPDASGDVLGVTLVYSPPGF